MSRTQNWSGDFEKKFCLNWYVINRILMSNRRTSTNEWCQSFRVVEEKRWDSTDKNKKALGLRHCTVK